MTDAALASMGAELNPFIYDDPLRPDELVIVRSGDALVDIDQAGRTDRKVAALPGVIVALSLPLYPGEYR